MSTEYLSPNECNAKRLYSEFYQNDKLIHDNCSFQKYVFINA